MKSFSKKPKWLSFVEEVRIPKQCNVYLLTSILAN